jgi:hypothetical protein
MSEPVWGLLEKSQVDNEKIEEAVDRIVEQHNDDETAHLETGQALQSHKAAEIIDHAALSIINDKIANGVLQQSKLSSTELQAYITFESMDGWNKSAAGITNSILGTAIYTGSTINTVRFISNEPSGIGDINPYNKDTFFQTAIKLNATTNQLVYFMTGDFQNDDSDCGFGFKVSNGTLYAIVVKAVGASRTEYTTEITGITLTNLNIYKAFYDYSEGKIYFYVNGVLKHTEETNLPGESHPVMFTYYIKNTAAESKIMGISYLFYSRKI